MDLLEQLELLEKRAQEVNQESQVMKEGKDHQVKLENQDMMVPEVIGETKELLVSLVQMGHLDLKVNVVLRVWLEQEENQERPELQAAEVNQVLKDPKDQRVRGVQRDPLVHKALQDTLANQDLRVLPEKTATQALKGTLVKEVCLVP